MKKARFFYLHPECNAGKIAGLDALQEAYTGYLKECVTVLLAAHRFSIPRSEKQAFFPPCEALSSQIIKNARDHAISIVSGWTASVYSRKLKKHIGQQFKNDQIDEATRKTLYILGKRAVDKPSDEVPQVLIDLYWSWLLDSKISGKTPRITITSGMRMSEMTCVFEVPEKTKSVAWWFSFSCLNVGRRIQVPLSGNPYVKQIADVTKGVLARKDHRGRWRFEFTERREWEVPEVKPDMPRIGMDAGLNVPATMSDGRLFGEHVKPRFTKLHRKVTTLRKNRQQQKLPKNSPRLARLEERLTGMMKTEAGQIAGQIAKAYPGYVIVEEALDLSGCPSQKRYRYKEVQKALEGRVPTIKVNPAYTSQECPSCGYVNSKNRNGTKFVCRSCGRKSHADVVGAKNQPGRSVDKLISLNSETWEVKAVLRERYLRKRNSSSGLPASYALEPTSRKLTAGVNKSSIASKIRIRGPQESPRAMS